MVTRVNHGYRSLPPHREDRESLSVLAMHTSQERRRPERLKRCGGREVRRFEPRLHFIPGSTRDNEPCHGDTQRVRCRHLRAIRSTSTCSVTNSPSIVSGFSRSTIAKRPRRHSSSEESPQP